MRASRRAHVHRVARLHRDRDRARRRPRLLRALEKSGAAAAFGEFVALDGASIGTGATEVTCGRDAVAKGFAPLGPGALIWAPRVADAAPSGDLAYTSGDATIRVGTDVSYSNYLTVWKRLANGQWRVVADGGNSAPAPASPP